MSREHVIQYRTTSSPTYLIETFEEFNFPVVQQARQSGWIGSHLLQWLKNHTVMPLSTWLHPAPYHILRCDHHRGSWAKIDMFSQLWHSSGIWDLSGEIMATVMSILPCWYSYSLLSAVLSHSELFPDPPSQLYKPQFSLSTLACKQHFQFS